MISLGHCTILLCSLLSPLEITWPGKKGVLGNIVVVSALAGAPTVVIASSETASEKSPAGPIVVTGERVARSQQETASSVAVITEDTIRGASAQRLDDLFPLVPNVQMGSGEEGPTIRGQDSTGVLRNLNAFLGGTRPRVTVQVDGRPVTYYEYVNSSAPLWDVGRVEIYRTPQTTTQGRNSIAGAIFIETNDPSYTWSGKAQMVAGSFDSRQGSFALSAPVIEDQLAIGVTGDVRLARMASDMADGIPGADIERDDYGIGRVKVLFEPSGVSGLRVDTTYVHTVSQAPQFEAAQAPFRLRRDPVPEQTNGVHRIKVDSLTTRAEYQPRPGLGATVTTSLGDARVRRFGLPGLGLTQVASRDYTGEGVLHYRSGNVALTGGANWLQTNQRQFIDISGLRIGTGSFTDLQHSTGLFGEAEWRPVPPLSITAGVRFQSDRQRRVGQVGPSGAGLALDYDSRFEAWLPKLSLAFHPTPEVTAGVLIQRAYNPGGTSINLAKRVGDSFEAETLWNREAFLRATFAGGRGFFSANVFSTRIRDAQRQQFIPVAVPGGGTIYATEFVNAPRARTSGLESELSWRSSAKLSVRAAVGLLRTRVVQTALPGDATLGKEFQRSPHVTAAVGLDWKPGTAWRISAQTRYHSGYFSDDLNRPDLRISNATSLDVRISYDTRPATVFAFARNALNSFSLGYLFTPTFGTPTDPRELGLGVEARF